MTRSGLDRQTASPFTRRAWLHLCTPYPPSHTLLYILGLEDLSAACSTVRPRLRRFWPRPTHGATTVAEDEGPSVLAAVAVAAADGVSAGASACRLNVVKSLNGGQDVVSGTGFIASQGH